MVCGVVHGPLKQGRQVEERIVAAPRLELLAHLRRPGRLAQLPTVDVEVLERLAGQRPGVGDQLRPRLGEMGVHRRGAHRVDLQPGRAGADALDHVAVQRVADPQHVPCAGRNVPVRRPWSSTNFVRSTIRLRCHSVARAVPGRLPFGAGQQGDLRHLHVPVLLAVVGMRGQKHDAEVLGPDFVERQGQLLARRERSHAEASETSGRRPSTGPRSSFGPQSGYGFRYRPAAGHGLVEIELRGTRASPASAPCRACRRWRSSGCRSIRLRPGRGGSRDSWNWPTASAAASRLPRLGTPARRCRDRIPAPFPVAAG